MNSTFVIAFIAVMAYSVITDFRYWSQRKKSQKFIYVIFGCTALAIFISWMFGVKYYLPTAYLTRTISPWVYDLTHHKQ